MRLARQRTHIIAAASLALAAALIGYAHAQVSPKTVSVEVSITTRVLTGRTGVEAPVDHVTLTHLVSYEDLDLTTQAGVQELRRRVAETARFACEQLDQLYPRQSESVAVCTEAAIQETETQVDAAINAAEREAQGE